MHSDYDSSWMSGVLMKMSIYRHHGGKSGKGMYL